MPGIREAAFHDKEEEKKETYPTPYYDDYGGSMYRDDYSDGWYEKFRRSRIPGSNKITDDDMPPVNEHEDKNYEPQKPGEISITIRMPTKQFGKIADYYDSGYSESKTKAKAEAEAMIQLEDLCPDWVQKYDMSVIDIDTYESYEFTFTFKPRTKQQHGIRS